MVAPGGAFQAEYEAAKRLLAHLAKEGERHVPQFPAGPAQVIADQPERGARGVQVVEDGSGRREPDEQPHDRAPPRTLIT